MMLNLLFDEPEVDRGRAEGRLCGCRLNPSIELLERLPPELTDTMLALFGPGIVLSIVSRETFAICGTATSVVTGHVEEVSVAGVLYDISSMG